jgi:cell wall-associated NlpC family hydrolase
MYDAGFFNNVADRAASVFGQFLPQQQEVEQVVEPQTDLFSEYLSRLYGNDSTGYVDPVSQIAAQGWQQFAMNKLKGKPQQSSATPAQSATQAPQTGMTNAYASPVASTDLRGQIVDYARQRLGDEGARVVDSVLETEGGLTGSIGDNGQSYGPFQFYAGGQLANLANARGMNTQQAGQWVLQNPLEAAKWGIDNYLGNAIKQGIGQGLSGPDLATFAQRTGQVSVSPERAGQNYSRLYGQNKDVLSEATKYVGTPYSLGGNYDRNRTLDCSSFVSRVYKSKGITLPAYTDSMYEYTQQVTPQNLKVGDLVFYKYYDDDQPATTYPHVAMFAGNGQVIDAQPNGGVQYRPLNAVNGAQIEFRRVRGT